MSTIKANVSATLGLLPLSVNVKSIVEAEKATSMSNVCVGTADAPHGPVKIQQINQCPDCKNDDKATHAKAKMVSKTELVLVPQAEIDAMSTEAKKYSEAMPITVHPADEVMASTIETGTAYYLEPATPAYAEIYALVAHEIRKNPDKVLVSMWAARTAPAMYRWTVKGDVIVIRQLAWPHQVQAAPSVPTTFNEAWESQADMFLASSAAEFDPDTYRDVRGEILSAYVASQTPQVTTIVEQSTVASKGIDVLALLKAGTTAAPVAKKAAAKKPAKKAAAKKAVKKAS